MEVKIEEDGEEEIDLKMISAPTSLFVFKDQIDEIFEWRVHRQQCMLKVRIKSTNECGWLPIDRIAKTVYVEWLTRQSLDKRQSVITTLNDEVTKREIELNMACFVLDQQERPRFLEKLLGITNDQGGKLEFIAKFKYTTQEQLIDADKLNRQVPKVKYSNALD